jgi:pseudaminic acid synthase
LTPAMEFIGASRVVPTRRNHDMQSEIRIAGRTVGPGHPPYIVAELSANHGGSLERALDTLSAAKAAGAEAVKLQTYTPDTMTLDVDNPDFVIKGGLWDGRRLYDLYREAQTPLDWHQALFAKARALGITIFSTPFDDTAVDFLETMDAPVYKIASFELVDHALIARAARTGKPLIISTGMASQAEISEAIGAATTAGCRQLLLLHCVSGYPTPIDQINLRRIPALAVETGLPIGLSDHTLGVEVSVAAVAMGACLIEKHFTLARGDGGPDAAFSLEPEEFARLTQGAASAFAALGDGQSTRSTAEKDNMVFRRSIYVVKNIAQGEAFTAENLRAVRPGFGLPPKHLPEILGRHARQALLRGTRLNWDAIE